MNFKRFQVLAVMVGLMVAATPAVAQEIGGEYAVDGTNLDGSKYSGIATITMTDASACTIKWKTGADGSISEGVCLRKGNTLGAAYTLGTSAGLVVYQMDSDGRLNGDWNVAGLKGVGTEVLTPKR